MQFEELLRLVQEVGKAGLSDFEYNEGNLHIKMSVVKDASREEKQEDYVVEANIPIREEKEVKKEVIEAPVEGVFYFARLDGTKCPLNPGDHISAGQVLGMMESRGQSFEITSDRTGKVINIYIEDGEELVAAEPMLQVAV